MATNLQRCLILDYNMLEEHKRAREEEREMNSIPRKDVLPSKKE